MGLRGAGIGWRRWVRVRCRVRAAGLVGGDHPLLGAVVERPDVGGVVLTAGCPWAPRNGWLIMPSAQRCCFRGRFVELVLRAGDEVGCGW